MAGGLRPDYPIRTARLDLRPHRPDDLDDLCAFHADPEVVRYVPWPVRDRQQTAAALQVKLGQGELTAPGQWLVLAMQRRDTGTVIGEVLLKWADDTDRQGELGFAVRRDQHGRGYAAEASRAMLRYGFDDLGLQRITAVCIDGNTASARLLQHLGLRLEGRLQHSVRFKGEWADQLLFAIRADEWRAGPDADRAEIAAIVGTFFAAFTSGPDVADRLDALRELFVPGGVVVRTCGAPEVYDVEGFIAPRRALLTEGRLTDFAEWSEFGSTDLAGDIAQHFCTYAKAGVQDGRAFSGRGTKSLQFVRLDGRWRISAAAWDDER